MPRRRQRFSKLEQQFRDSGGVAAPGSRLEGYINFKKGINKIKVTERLTAEERKRYGFAILPFSLSVPANPAADDRYAAGITAYSNAGRISLGLSNNQCGYDDIGAGTNQADNFYPALMKCFVPGATDAGSGKGTPTSNITKEEYNRTYGRTYGIPFGRTVTQVDDAKTGAGETTVDDADEQDVRFALATAAKTGQGTTKATSVTFLPEEFKVGKPDLVSPPAA